MNVGSCFSGIGGFDLGLERAGMRVEWQVENNEWCREVLKKHWPQVPCHYDITKIDWRDIHRVDLICGGFPCQPFSLAGKRAGQADNRYLWPEVVRCLDTLRPTWFLGENVPGIINLALDQVCADLESLGYTVWPVCVPACAVDAPHRRDRVWIVAHAQSLTERSGLRSDEPTEQRRGRSRDGCGQDGDVADTERLRLERSRPSDGRPARSAGLRGRARHDQEQHLSVPTGRRWAAEPAICRVAHGVPRRVDRLRGLGNAVVPAIVEAFGRMIIATQEGPHDGA